MIELKQMNLASTRTYHRQAMNIIKQAIADGELKQGDTMPTVTALAQHWGIARTTAALATAQLRREGHLRRQGRRLIVGGDE